MTSSVPMVEIWRGDYLESVHRGFGVVARANGEIVASWGDPDRVILPRSSCKSLQALPLIESGAADTFGLDAQHLALAGASHQGAAIHSERVAAWLSNIGLSDSDLRCGAQWPNDRPAANSLIKSDTKPCQYHNNCSGKHAGFLTLTKHIGAGPEYIDPAHPLQITIRDTLSEMTGEELSGYGIDGCSAPNFAMTVAGLARGMAKMADPSGLGATRKSAAERLVQAMILWPELVAGEGRACTELMRAMDGVAIKTGAEGVFIAILPKLGLGVALKIEDGTTRAAEAAIVTVLIRLGVLDANSNAAKARVFGPIRNWVGTQTGETRADPAFYAGGSALP